MWKLLLAVLFSGAASLVYQVVWTKKLIGVTSATVTAQAVVLSVFMAGLGLGAYFAGRRAKRLARPLLGYVAVELGAMLLAFLSVPLIGASDAIRTLLFGFGVPLSSGLWVQLFVVSGFLLLPTILLGASLPFLLEHVERTAGATSPTARGRAAGLLYGVNTLGAAGGSILAGFVLIERIGLFASLGLGAAFAVGAAVIAAVSSRSVPADEAQEAPGARSELVFVVAAALGGFIGLGAEVVWTRLVALVIPNTTYAFTQVLAAVLIGIGLGAHLAALIVRSVRGQDSDAARSKLLTLSAYLSLFAAVLLALVPLLLMQLADAEAIRVSIGQGSWGSVLLGLILVPPSAVIAALLPLLVAGSRLRHGSQAFGELYAANTIGSVLGSAVVGFVFLPLLGTWGAGLVLTVAALGLAALLFVAAQTQRQGLRLGALAALTTVLLTFSADIPRDIYRLIVGDGVKVLAFREGKVSDVMITEDQVGTRRIWINSNWVATTSRTLHSGLGPPHRVLGHLPALLVDHPRRAVGIALGTGQTFAAVVKHGFDEFHCVEINPAVIELSARWFKEANEGVLESPRVTVHNDDGRAFLRAAEKPFDLIVLEPLQAWAAGTTNLYTREFYEEARAVLADGGVVAQWIPFYGQGPDETRSMVEAGLAVFPNSTLWLDKFDGILIMRKEPVELSLEVFAQRIRDRKLEAALGGNALADPADLMSLFAMGPEGLAAWVKGARPLTDDHPFLEFVAARQTGIDWFPPIMASGQPHLEPPEKYRVETSSAARQLFAQAEIVRDAVYEVGKLDGQAFEKRAEVLERALPNAPGSHFLRVKYRDLILEWSGSPSTRQRGAAAMAAALARGIENDPDQGEAMVNLAQIRSNQGRLDDARDLLERAIQIERVRPVAERILSGLGR